MADRKDLEDSEVEEDGQEVGGGREETDVGGEY